MALETRSLTAYDHVWDTCRLREWTVELDWGRYGWTLAVRDRGDLVVKVAADTIAQLGIDAGVALVRSGRLA